MNQKLHLSCFSFDLSQLFSGREKVKKNPLLIREGKRGGCVFALPYFCIEQNFNNLFWAKARITWVDVTPDINVGVTKKHNLRKAY